MVKRMTIEGPLYYYWVSHPNLQYIVSPVLRNSKLYTKAVEDLNNLTFFRLRNAFYKYNIIYNMSSDGRLSHHACQIAHEHTDGVIKMRKSQLQNEEELQKARKKRHLDFLDILLFARVSWVQG